jgi:hypothetical protein
LKPWVIEPCSQAANPDKTEASGVQSKKGPRRALSIWTVSQVLK